MLSFENCRTLVLGSNTSRSRVIEDLFQLVHRQVTIKKNYAKVTKHRVLGYCDKQHFRF